MSSLIKTVVDIDTCSSSSLVSATNFETLDVTGILAKAGEADGLNELSVEDRSWTAAGTGKAVCEGEDLFVNSLGKPLPSGGIEAFLAIC